MTIKDILSKIEYIVIIDGVEHKDNNIIFSTWNENMVKQSEKASGYKPEKMFDPVARDNYQKYIAVAYYAGFIPAKVIETRTNEIGKDGCYIFTVETFGSLKPDEETEEDNTKENRKRSQIMKTQNLKVHGIYHMFNVGGIEVHIEEGYDPLVYWRYSIIDEKPQKWHKAKVTYTAAGRSYFQANGKQIYLDQVMSV